MIYYTPSVTTPVFLGFPVAQIVKNLTAVQEAWVRSQVGLGRSPGGVHGDLLQHSCLENPMDRGAWPATANRITMDQT